MGRECPRCGSDDTYEGTHRSMPYRCRSWWKQFSVRTGTVLACSKVPLRKWAYTIYLDVTSRKGVSSRKPHCDLGVTQKTAWLCSSGCVRRSASWYRTIRWSDTGSCTGIW